MTQGIHCRRWQMVLKADLSSKGNQPTAWKKSISRWEKATYRKSKAWKKLGQASPKDASFYHSGFICWPISWLMVLMKLSCHSSLCPLLCKGLVQGHSFSPGPPAVLPTQEQPVVAHWATYMKCVPQQWTDRRLQAVCVWPWVDRDHLDQVCFCTDPYCVPIKCGLLTTAALVCT